METVEKLQEVVEKMDGAIPKDQVLKEFSEALDNFKQMIQDGIASPRGNQQEDITSRHRYMFR
jgi:hypothetical protein